MTMYHCVQHMQLKSSITFTLDENRNISVVVRDKEAKNTTNF